MAGEWVEARLGDICTFAGGTAFPKKYQGSIGGPVPFIKVSDMNLPANARKIVEANNWIDEGVAAHTRARRHPAGAVVFAKIGVALTYNRRRILTRPTVIDNNMMAAIPNIDAVDPLFLYYLLTTVDFNEVVAGTALPYLNAGDLTEMEVKIPRDKGEQRAIAHILGTLDDKIELNRRMSETLEAMARALFKSWFVDFDPVRAKAEGRDPGLPKPLADLFPSRLVDSELGEIPEGWKATSFGAVVEQLREKENPLESPDAKFRHFSIPAFDDGQWPRIQAGESIKSQKSRVAPGAVLLSKLNPEIERVWLVDVQPDDRSVCSTEFLVLRPRPPYGRSYVYCLARSPVFRQEIEGLVTGTSKSHQRARVGAILGLGVIRPPEPLLTQFETKVGPLLGRTLACRRESRTLASLRDTLLPKLISGELRIENAERIVARADA